MLLATASSCCCKARIDSSEHVSNIHANFPVVERLHFQHVSMLNYVCVMAYWAHYSCKHNKIKLLLYIFLVFVNYFLILNVGDSIASNP